MWGMISGEAVDDIHICPEGIPVLRTCQSGSHLRAPCPDPGDIFPGQQEVVRANLAGDRDASLLCEADEQDLFAKGYMRQVDRTVK